MQMGLLNIPGSEEEEEMRTKQVTTPGKPSRALAKYDGTKEDFESYVLTRLRKEGRTVGIAFWEKPLMYLRFPMKNAENNYRDYYLKALEMDERHMLAPHLMRVSRNRTVTYDNCGGIQLNPPNVVEDSPQSEGLVITYMGLSSYNALMEDDDAIAF